MLRIFAQAIPDIESWPQENEARLVTRDGFGQHRGFSFAKANEYDIATLHQCIAQDKVARQSRFLEIADFLEAIPTASVQASQASPSVAREWICKQYDSAPQLAASGKPQLVHVLARIAREETSCNEEVPELDQLPIAKMRKEFAPREEPGS